MLVLLCIINLVISFTNARAVGLAWCETKAIGGWPRLLVWCGAIQSAIGFTMVYMVIAVTLLLATGKMTPESAQQLADFIYLMIIVPALGTGFIITIHSWIAVARERSLKTMGVAAWNTFASVHNAYGAYKSFGAAFDSVGKVLIGEGKDRKKDANIILLAILVLLLGVATTTAIVRRYAGTMEVPECFMPKRNKPKIEWQKTAEAD